MDICLNDYCIKIFSVLNRPKRNSESEPSPEDAPEIVCVDIIASEHGGTWATYNCTTKQQSVCEVNPTSNENDNQLNKF